MINAVAMRAIVSRLFLPLILLSLLVDAPGAYAQADSDGDGMSDSWEQSYNLDPYYDDAEDDLDTDGVSNLQEYLTDTDPTDSDAFIAADIFVPIPVDSILTFIPIPADTDGDGIPDEWEMAHGLYPGNPADAAADPDDDYQSNLYEYRHRTDPNVQVFIDSDGDGWLDDVDKFRNDPDEWADTDNDGIGDNSDPLPGGDPLLSMASVTGESQSTLVYSESVTIPASIFDGFFYTGITELEGISDIMQLSVNDGPFRSVNLRNMDTLGGPPIEAGDTIRARLRSSAEQLTASRVKISIGPDLGGANGIDIEWSVTTAEIDTGQKDSDGDGHWDHEDEFPHDKDEYKDSDGDGVGDEEDDFEHNANETKDSDGDGVGDNQDDFPEIPGQTLDLNKDGIDDASQGMDVVRLVLPENPNNTAVLTAFSFGDSDIACRLMTVQITGEIFYEFGNLPDDIAEVTFSWAHVPTSQLGPYTRTNGEVVQRIQEQYFVAAGPETTKTITGNQESVLFDTNEIYPDLEYLALGDWVIRASFMRDDGSRADFFDLQAIVHPAFRLNAFHASSTETLAILAPGAAVVDQNPEAKVFQPGDSISFVANMIEPPPHYKVQSTTLHYTKVGTNANGETIAEESGSLSMDFMNTEYGWEFAASEAPLGIWRAFATIDIEDIVSGEILTYNSETAQIIVSNGTPLPEISADSPQSMSTGETAEITWQSSNAAYCAAAGNGNIFDNSVTLGPFCAPDDFTVDVVCFGLGGSSELEIEISVTGANVCPVGPIPPPVPIIPDSDGDGLNDFEEQQLGTSPILSDTDGDGLSDGLEVELETDPLNPDTDGDDVSDGVEVANGSNPIDASDSGIDKMPFPFSFAAQTGVAPGQSVMSNIVTATDFAEAMTLSVESVQGNVEFEVDGSGNWTTSALVSPGSTFRLRMTASTQPRVKHVARASLGSHTAVWGITTQSGTIASLDAHVEPAPSSASIAASDTVGTIAGGFAVNKSGAATYSNPCSHRPALAA